MGLKIKIFTRQGQWSSPRAFVLDMSIDSSLCGLTSQWGNQNFAAMTVIVYAASNLRLRSSVASQPATFEHISKLKAMCKQTTHWHTIKCRRH